MPFRGITDEDLSGPVLDRRTTLRVLGASSAFSALAGCAGNQEPTNKTTPTGTDSKNGTNSPASKKKGGKLIAGWDADKIAPLDPVINSAGIVEQASMQVHNALVRTTPKLRIVPEAAKNWSVKKQGQQYVFRLREGMQFHKDYGEVTAEDVKFTIKRGLQASGSTTKPKLSVIKSPLDEGVVIRDKYTVEINLEKPFVPFLGALSRGGGACNIICKQAFQDMGAQQYRVTPLASGAFMVDTHKVGQELRLKAHPDYWETDDNGVQYPYVDTLSIKPIPKASTTINGLRSGDIQITNFVPLGNLNQIREAEGVQLIKGPAGGWIGFEMNANHEPFSSRKARRGIAKLLDSKQFVKRAKFGNAMPALGPLSPVHGPSWRPQEKKPNYQKYNKSEGERLIKEAGVKGASFELQARNGRLGGPRSARVVKNMLDPYFDVTINTYDTPTFIDRRNPRGDLGRKFDSDIWGSDVDINTDTTLYFFFKTYGKGGKFNQFGYSDQKVDQWLEKERVTPDQKVRANLFQKVEDRVMQDAPIGFLFHIIPWQAKRNEVKGYQPHPFRRPLYNVWVQD